MSEDKKAMIAIAPSQGLALTTLDDVYRSAKMFVQSGMFGSPETSEVNMAKACVKIIAGQELGLKPFQAMRGIDVINGQPAYRYQLVAAKVKQSGRYDFKTIESTKKIARIQFYDRGVPDFLSEFSMQDAVDQQLAGKDGYKKFPADMLFARAMTKGVNKVCPEIFFGECYTPEDFGHHGGQVIVETEVVETKEVATDPPARANRGLNFQESGRAIPGDGKPVPIIVDHAETKATSVPKPESVAESAVSSTTVDAESVTVGATKSEVATSPPCRVKLF